nr:glycosyltransferase [Hoeflea prorocentri]
MRRDAHRKHALLSYLNEGIRLAEDDPFFDGHTNKWECREIAHILFDLGYNVDVIHYLNDSFLPAKPYDVVIDLHGNLPRLAPHLTPDCRMVLHATGSYVPSMMEAEAQRLEALKRRRGIKCRPRRISDGDAFKASIEASGHISLIGNRTTLSTYPLNAQSKITCINPSPSRTKAVDRSSLPEQREFMWLGGGGAVLKGLDLLLDCFVRRPDLHLHIVGGVSGERDFSAGYATELFQTDNIHYHGFMDLAGDEFNTLAARCVSVLKPSASEGMSTSVTTAMTIGLYPIISRQTGIDLPDGAGIYLRELTCDAIDEAIDRFLLLSDEQLLDDLANIKRYAQTQYSRQAFSSQYRSFLTNTVGV